MAHRNACQSRHARAQAKGQRINAGGTNALRTQGKLFALLVMIMDVGKGYVAARFLPMLALPAIPIDPEVSRAWLALACGGAAIVGSRCAMLERLSAHRRDLALLGVTREDVRETCARMLVQTLEGLAPRA